MKELFGKPLAERILADIKKQCPLFLRPPGLAAILVGENEASKLYVDLKKRTAKQCGIEFFDYRLPEIANEEDVLAVIRHLNDDDDIDGILVQLPLPKTLRYASILETIHPEKDVDGLTSENRRRILSGETGFVCPFPRAIAEMVISVGESWKGKRAIILANSHIFAESVSMIFEKIGFETEAIILEKGVAFCERMREADVVITATGIPNLVSADCVRDGAIVIDGGIDRFDEGIRGDVNRESFRDRDVVISPVPGGVGPLTVACLLENVVSATKRNLGIDDVSAQNTIT
jgi:methylenetetrahydrofolate dehydrogenase (NADP+)/methenyltetrahydrofolate cyclohydrolase